MAQDVVFTRERHLGIITLNRTHALNALTFNMILLIQQQLHAWQEDPHIHAVVINAVPGKAFCAGGDVLSLYEARHTPEQQLLFFWHEYRLNHFIHHFNKPYIALMDGITMGGGVGVSLHGSHPVASDRFIFAMPETSIGFFPDIGASYLLTRCPDSFGAYLGLTGSRVTAAEAKALGLVQHVILATHFPAVLIALMEADLSIDAHLQVDACLQAFAMPMPTPTALLMPYQPMINDCFHCTDVEAIFQKLASSDDALYRKCEDSLKSKSPLSLKITLAQLQKAKGMSFADCVKMDYCLVGHFMRDHDFYEGVRALLVDKDKNPQWQSRSLFEVSSAQVKAYFQCGQPQLPLGL